MWIKDNYKNIRDLRGNQYVYETGIKARAEIKTVIWKLFSAIQFNFVAVSAQNIFILLPPTARPPFNGRWDGWSLDSGQYLIVWALSPLALHRGQV